MVIDRGGPGAEVQREKGQPLILHLGVGQQWLYMTFDQGTPPVGGH